MQSGDTIVAVSSAVGVAPRMIVRMSGPSAIDLATKLVNEEPTVGATTCRLRLSERIELPITIYRFDSPRTVTGEHVIEFHIPGNVWIVRRLVETLTKLGARQAEPGEFTARAYFNGKLDLTEAEGVAAIVSARSEAELTAARQLMSGELSRRLQPIMDELADILALVEAGIDFSDEPVSFHSTEDTLARCASIERSLKQLLDESPRFERIAHEPTVVLAGRPNAGKSTLLNALAGFDRAVVSPVAGTTRDAIGAVVHLRRGLVRVIDVAGLEQVRTDDRIDIQMQDVARRAIETADVLVLVVDPGEARPTQLQRDPDLVVHTKSDLRQAGGVSVSAHTGANMSELRDQLDDLCFGTTTSASEQVALTARHVQAIEQTVRAVDRARSSVRGGAEIVALELREALDSLGQVRGAVSADDVLGRVFARFCIGK
jgi:tRNA modification GTPase